MSRNTSKSLGSGLSVTNDPKTTNRAKWPLARAKALENLAQGCLMYALRQLAPFSKGW